jgi:hypothetical protein
MSKRHSSFRKEEMRRIIEAWKASGGRWPATSAEIARFAIHNHLYNSQSLALLCARELARSMREEYTKDESGRSVRKLHAVKITERDESGKKTQRTLWGDEETFDRMFMETSFQQRRTQIVGDCCQLDNDVEYRNNRHPDELPIKMSYDFTDDVAEHNMPTEYCPQAPKD